MVLSTFDPVDQWATERWTRRRQHVDGVFHLLGAVPVFLGQRLEPRRNLRDENHFPLSHGADINASVNPPAPCFPSSGLIRLPLGRGHRPLLAGATVIGPFGEEVNQAGQRRRHWPR